MRADPLPRLRCTIYTLSILCAPLHRKYLEYASRTSCKQNSLPRWDITEAAQPKSSQQDNPLVGPQCPLLNVDVDVSLLVEPIIVCRPLSRRVRQANPKLMKELGDQLVNLTQ